MISIEYGALGTIFVVTSNGDQPPHRAPLKPGRWEDAAWVATDLSGYPQDVQDAASAHWTPEVVDAFKLAFPAPPAPKTDAEMDQDALNTALIAPGSVVRALGLVMFGEINKLRVKNGDAAYTLTQFKNALLAQMR